MFECPCGSKQRYGKCCEPYHKGKEFAKTAEALMRARYSAYVKAEINFLKETLHPDPSEEEEFDEDQTRQWAESSKWLGLEIDSIKDGLEDDDYGMVEFTASYESDGQRLDHHERAYFEKVDERWYFVEGKVGPKTFKRNENKVGRNDPCTCGSGKKYKKCCA